MEIGKRIQTRRKELGMTQEQLATAVYVTPQAVSQWENHKSIPDICNIGLIAAALKIDKADLISDEAKNRPSWIVRDQFFSDRNMYRKLKEFAENEGLVQTDRAIDYAREMHRGQLRKTSAFSGEAVPYVVHPFIMACHAHALGITEDAALAVTLLHDVCEDCGVVPGDLPFDDTVKEAVTLLTKPSEKSPAIIRAYFERISENRIAAIVKALDRCNNLSTMMLGFSVEKIMEYVDETQVYILPLLDHIKRSFPEYYDAAFVLKYQILSVLESSKAAILRL